MVTQILVWVKLCLEYDLFIFNKYGCFAWYPWRSEWRIWFPWNWSYRRLWATIWKLGTEPGSSVKVIRLLNAESSLQPPSMCSQNLTSTGSQRWEPMYQRKRQGCMLPLTSKVMITHILPRPFPKENLYSMQSNQNSVLGPSALFHSSGRIRNSI